MSSQVRVKTGLELKSESSESTANSVYKRDSQLINIQEKMEENRKKMLGNRLLLKNHAKTNPHISGLVKIYDEYYNNLKTNIKMQIHALEKILKHLNKMMEDKNDMSDDEINESQLKKDKKIITKEIATLKKMLIK